MGIYDSNYDLNKYKIFYAVAECNSFSKAASLLHISQPAISYAIKELENYLKIKLFIRENKAIKLTDEGEKLMYHLQKAFNDIIVAERSLKEQDLTGEVRIGLYSHIALFMLPKIIKEISNQNPNIKFNILTSNNDDLKEKLKNGELDFIILQYPIYIDKSNFTEEIVCELETCFFGNKSFFDIVNKHNINDIYPLSLPYRGFADIDAVERLLKNNNINIAVNYRIYATEVSRELAKEGLCIGWGLKKFIEKDLQDHTLYEIPFNFKTPNTKYSIAYNNKRLNKSSISFLKIFKDKIKEIH